MRKPTFSFENGVLTVDGPMTTYRLRWSPEPLAEELLIAPDKWTACWPDFRILKPLVEDKPTGPESTKDAAFNSFREQIPAGILAAVERFESHQWPLLLMLHAQPLALDLAASNPALAFALANNNDFRRTRIEAAGFQAAAYALRKQRWIQEWLGFPGSKAAEKLLRKIPVEAISLPLLRRLKYAMQSDPKTLELLGHQRVINTTVLQLVTNDTILPSVSPQLLEEAADITCREGERTLGDHILDIVTMRQDVAPGIPTQVFRSIKQVHDIHDNIRIEYATHLQRIAEAQEQERIRVAEERYRLAENARLTQRLSRVKNDELDNRPYPTPPFEGTPTITPITSYLDLQIEGQEQRNCVATYLRALKVGCIYFYRVTEPERATLLIFRGTDGCWRRSELRGYNNAKPKRETVIAVDRWLAQYNHSV